ncbi:lysylphosphatidylglycerol synthetase-like protein (DUF2156 family) [Edaphobacter lichenicola]|uniref:Lysylphosphatidylglycerol synthetase-like protein (DUF2156 family) n=1 Tax=Tunturiibacter lichenicola TaxID=2051959 RepID=A0A852V756_9BACT|nr:lysylphosphatidylglycerol synthetase-like protein (DUF2156 family) [Edaphobacter lichenicola]
MTVKSNVKRHREFSTSLLFQIEQWIVLLLGIACLAVFLWAALDGHKAFSIRHLSHFSTTTIVFTGWLLTIAVGLIGVTLMRFAFYKRSESEPDAKSMSKRVRTASGGSTKNSSRLMSITADKRRR